MTVKEETKITRFSGIKESADIGKAQRYLYLLYGDIQNYSFIQKNSRDNETFVETHRRLIDEFYSLKKEVSQ